MKSIFKLTIVLMLSLLLFPSCTNEPASILETDEFGQPIAAQMDEAPGDKSEELIRKESIIIEGDVTPIEKDLIINGEKFIEKVTSGLTKYEQTSETNRENALAVMIGNASYAPLLEDFGYHSVAELKEALLSFFSEEYINTTPIFNRDIADEYDVPVYYMDFDGELYMWDGGDYFYEGAHYIWDSEMSLKTVSRNGDIAVIQFCLYIKPLYSGNIWCTRYFTIESGKICSIEHINDYSPNVDDFIGNWAGYDEDGKFVIGYCFYSNPNRKWFYENGAAVEYHADGTSVTYDKHSFDFGWIMLGESNDNNWLWIETFSHDGFYEFTASKTQDNDTNNETLTPTLIYKRVNDISIVNGRTVIE